MKYKNNLKNKSAKIWKGFMRNYKPESSHERKEILEHLFIGRGNFHGVAATSYDPDPGQARPPINKHKFGYPHDLEAILAGDVLIVV